MSKLHERIELQCKKKNVTITEMCREAGVSRGSLTDLKMGRIEELSAKSLTKIAVYFGVSVGYLLGNEQKETPGTETGRSDDDDIKFALFGGGGEITDAMFDEVKQFAQMVKLREENKKKKE